MNSITPQKASTTLAAAFLFTLSLLSLAGTREGVGGIEALPGSAGDEGVSPPRGDQGADEHFRMLHLGTRPEVFYDTKLLPDGHEVTSYLQRNKSIRFRPLPV